MGISFVFVFYLIVLTIVATPIALIIGSQSWFRGDLSRINRVIRTYATAYTWFVGWIICIGIASGIEGRDIGFGDYWVRNISGELSVCAIDVPESMSLCKGSEVMPGQKFRIQTGEILIQDSGSKYCIDMNGDRIQCRQSQDTLMMTTPYDYYYEDEVYVSIRSALIAIMNLLLASILIWNASWRKSIFRKSLAMWVKLRKYVNDQK